MMMRFVAAIPILTALLCGCTPKQTPSAEPAVREWERIEYISAHLAVAVSDGTARLITAEGNIIASGDDSEALKAGAEAAYARFLDEEFSDWEDILNRYDSLCNACIAREPADELLERLNRLRDRVQHASGRMDPQQRERFSAIRDRYETYRR